MADMNKIKSSIQEESIEIERRLRELLVKYEDFYREGNKMFVDERQASQSMDGLEDFYRLIQTIRRNRDVVASLFRGMKNIRSIDRFQFVEEEIPEGRSNPAPQKKAKKKKKRAKQPKPQLQAPKSGEAINA